jgi:cytochrome b
MLSLVIILSVVLSVCWWIIGKWNAARKQVPPSATHKHTVREFLKQLGQTKAASAQYAR